MIASDKSAWGEKGKHQAFYLYVNAVEYIMEINIAEFKKIADGEIINPQWAITKQFLEVNKIKMIDDEYVYERYSIGSRTQTYIDRKNLTTDVYNYDEIGFYYEVEDSRYFYYIGVDINKKDISDVGAVNGTYCYLSADSLDMTLEEMAKLTKLKYTEGASKGQKTNRGRGFYACSWAEYKFTDLTSYELEKSLNMLLDELEKDKEGVRKLAERTNASIVIVKYQYVSANAGIEIDIKTIERLKELNLGFWIDMYIQGERFIS